MKLEKRPAQAKTQGSNRRLEGWKQVAAHLGRSPTTVKKWARKDGLPVQKIGSGKRPRYFAFSAELDTWLANRAPVAPEARPLWRRRTGLLIGLTLAAMTLVGLTVVTIFVQREVLDANLRKLWQGPLPIIEKTDTGILARLEGNVLWEKDGFLPATAFARFEGEPSRRLLAIRSYGGFLPEDVRFLHILDPWSGNDTRKLQELYEEDDGFDDYANRFEPSVIHAFDLNDDDLDEILVTYRQIPNYPMFHVLWSPARDSPRWVYLSTGHQHYLGTADVDRDGHRDLLFGGVNNLMGWYNGVAAVRIPWLDDPTAVTATAASPNYETRFDPWEVLIWYAVLESGYCQDEATCFAIDEATGTLTFGWGEDQQVLDFDGFSPGSESELDLGSRQDGRQRVYRNLVELERAILQGRLVETDEDVVEALAAVRGLGTPLLENWVRRVEMRTLFLAGRRAVAARRLAELQTDFPEMGGLQLYEAAVALHLARDYEAAEEHYRQALALGMRLLGRGRPQWEAQRNLVLLYLGQQRFAEMSALAASFRVSTDAAGLIPVYYALATWDQEKPGQIEYKQGGQHSDLLGYWRLELLWAGVRPSACQGSQRWTGGDVLEQVEFEQARNSEAELLLQALEADILHCKGLEAEARNLITQAREDSLARSAWDVKTLAHLWLVERRYGAITGSASIAIDRQR